MAPWVSGNTESLSSAYSRGDALRSCTSKPAPPSTLSISPSLALHLLLQMRLIYIVKTGCCTARCLSALQTGLARSC